MAHACARTQQRQLVRLVRVRQAQLVARAPMHAMRGRVAACEGLSSLPSTRTTRLGHASSDPTHARRAERFRPGLLLRSAIPPSTSSARGRVRSFQVPTGGAEEAKAPGSRLIFVTATRTRCAAGRTWPPSLFQVRSARLPAGKRACH